MHGPRSPHRPLSGPFCKMLADPAAGSEPCGPLLGAGGLEGGEERDVCLLPARSWPWGRVKPREAEGGQTMPPKMPTSQSRGPVDVSFCGTRGTLQMGQSRDLGARPSWVIWGGPTSSPMSSWERAELAPYFAGPRSGTAVPRRRPESSW